ncbi:MAG: hypothetical protein ACN4E6_13005 [Qipengyuania pacifica]
MTITGGGRVNAHGEVTALAVLGDTEVAQEAPRVGSWACRVRPRGFGTDPSPHAGALARSDDRPESHAGMSA